jgi:hypothetical protein
VDSPSVTAMPRDLSAERGDLLAELDPNPLT